MDQTARISLFLLRISLGWLFFYAGTTKVLNPEWTAAGFLKGAKTFPALYQWFGSSSNIGWVNFLNEWGLLLIGASLILGLGVRVASVFGILLMILYYFPGLSFPNVKHGFLIDDHIIYILVLLLFILVRAGRFWGLDTWVSKQIKFPWI